MTANTPLASESNPLALAPAPAPPPPLAQRTGGPVHRWVRLFVGGLLSLVALGVGLWAASKALQGVLMAIVWVKQIGGGVDPRAYADLFVGSSTDPASGMKPIEPAGPGAFALEAFLSLLAAVAGFVCVWVLIRMRRWSLRHVVETSLTRFISGRYLLSRASKTLVSLITVISVLGVAVGVTALIVVISVIEGFDQVLVERTMGVFSHLEIWPYYGDETLSHYEKIEQQVAKLPGVEGVASIINHQTFFQSATGVERDRVGGILRGLDPEREHQVTKLTHNIIAGTGMPGDGEIVVGSELAKRLRVQPGDSVYLLGKLARRATGPMFKMTRVEVVGIFKCGLYDIDAGLAYSTLSTVRKVFMMGDTVSAVHVRIRDPHESFTTQSTIQETIGPGYLVRTWQQINPQFFEALRMEKMVMFIILLLIVLVAAFNIIGTLVMVVTQKTREIGILKSMGANRTDILLIFLYHGFMIGIFGTGLGLALGLRLCWFVENHIEKIYQLPGNVYYGLDRLPVVVEPWTIAFILACSLIICVGAAIVPAFQASRLNPVEALRYE